MKKRYYLASRFAVTFIIVALVGSLTCLPTSKAVDADPRSLIGKAIDNFALLDSQGASHSLTDWKDKQAIAVVFFGTECPLARRYAPRLSELATQYAAKGVQFVGIDANQQDTLVEIGQFARVHKIDFPLLKDPGNKIADQFGATRTPEVFLLDADRKVRYSGAIDDQYGVGVARPKAGKEYLAAALEKLLAGEVISTPTTQAVGCFIGRPSQAKPAGDVTYSKQIARIFNKNCVECHRAGQIAPFALTSYDEAAPWAETIREVVRGGRMPPWHADPKFGNFHNDRRLSDEEKKLIDAWVANGVPQGDPRDLPEPLKFVEGWRIPQPDLVIRMPQEYRVPAKGVVPYQYFTVDPGFKEDVWIRGAEGRPGNRSVVHHMLLFYLPPGQDRMRGQEALNNAIASYVPGIPAHLGPDSHAFRVPAGSKLIFQMHYTPNGSEQVDQSEAGLVLADPAKVQKEILQAAALNWQFVIPAGAPDHRVDARYRLSEDVELYSLVPHMHYRGKSFKFTAVYSDGREEVLLDVPRYDFNWQNIYMLQQPKLLPDGTDLVCEAHFDNSANNPVNPDPAQAVRWGDQTWQEMVVGSFAMGKPEQDLRLGPPQVKRLDDGRYEVHFRYKPAAAADAVYLAGEFNQWKPDALKMDGPDRDGFYTTKLPLAAGRYEYKFVINGERWRPDPGNREQAGDYRNSVVRVGP